MKNRWKPFMKMVSTGCLTIIQTCYRHVSTFLQIQPTVDTTRWVVSLLLL